jgi:hypothetical protein
MLAWALVVVVGCATAQPASQGSADSNPLRVPRDTADLAAHPELLARIEASPHGYYRFINRAFSREVCARFEDVLPSLPTVNLHGDAHLEQYAVTDVSRGLTDFDDSSRGPPVLDLVRFGVSIFLAARQFGWEDQADEFFAVFLDGYRAGLEDPAMAAPEPELARALRSRFRADRRSFLEWAATVIEPVTREQRREIEAALVPCFRRMMESGRSEASSLDYYDVVTMGRLRLGIGSALDEKYLIRVQGPSPDPEDDVILELKEVRDLSGIPCIDGSSRVDPFRILVGQARIAYAPYEHLGYLELHGRALWVHSWVMNYRELDVSAADREPADLAEVAFDVGVQLGRGHPNQIATPMDAELRAELVRDVDALGPRLRDEVRQLAALTVQAWAEFRASAPTPEE